MKKKDTFSERKCSMCGESFMPASGSQKFCESCKAKRRRETMANFKAREREKAESGKLRCCICGGKYGEMIHGKPYCHKHRRRYRKYGSFDLPQKVLPSSIEVDGNVLKITTSDGSLILADTEDLDTIKDHAWRLSSQGYAVTGHGESQLYMHRLIMQDYLTDDTEVDHANGNRADNRKQNLRACKHRENMRNCKISKNNTSGYPGVWLNHLGRYRAGIMVNGKAINLGSYATFMEAVAVRKRAEDKYHGTFAAHIQIEQCQENKTTLGGNKNE